MSRKRTNKSLVVGLVAGCVLLGDVVAFGMAKKVQRVEKEQREAEAK